jgi:hypothetical protein
MKKFGELNQPQKQPKDTLAPRLTIKGLLPRSRVLLGQFPAAMESNFIRLSLAPLEHHQFKIVTIEDKSDAGVEKDGEQNPIKVVHQLQCLGLQHRGPAYVMATFEDADRAEQALQAVISAFSSKKKWVIGGVVAAALWMLLFMPLPQSGAPRVASANAVPSISPASLGMQQRLQQQGIQMPATSGQLPLSTASTSGPLPAAVPGMAAVPGAAPIPSNQGAPITATAGEDDPFGLKIGPNGGSAGGPLQQQVR